MMTDTLVSQLYASCTVSRVVMGALHCGKCLTCQAADEIERLRMVIRNYHKAEQEYSQEWDDGYNDDHIVVLCDSWKRAWQALDDEATRE